MYFLNYRAMNQHIYFYNLEPTCRDFVMFTKIHTDISGVQWDNENVPLSIKTVWLFKIKLILGEITVISVGA